MFRNGKEIEEQDKHQFWQAHVGVWERSGVRQAEYCRRNRLNIKIFGYWKRKLCRKASELTFIPVTIKATHPPDNKSVASLRLDMGEDYGIEIGDGLTRIP